MSVAFSTTCRLVTMMPLGSMMKPEPRKRRPRGAAECSAEPAVLATVVPVAGLGARRMEMLTTAGSSRATSS